jgi:N-acetylmuramoyl-L-alanine amidase
MAHKIVEKKYKWARPLYRRKGPALGITLHHTASSRATPDQVHSWHVGRGWSGMAYNAHISKKGVITRGRPIGMLTGHALGCSHKLGIVFEGNFEKEKMSDAQVEAGRWLVKRWRKLYKLSRSKVKRHGDEAGNATACPGKNFRFKEIVG